MVIHMTTVGQKMGELADAVRKASGSTSLLGIDDMISIVSSLTGNATDVDIQYGYIDDDGNFQRVDVDATGNVIDIGTPEEMGELYIFDANRPDPEY